MKSKFIAFLLWLFFGYLGFHRMYCDKWGTGILWLLTCGLFGFGWFIDLFLISNMVDIANLKSRPYHSPMLNSNINNITIQMPNQHNQNPKPLSNRNSNGQIVIRKRSY